MCIHIPSCCFCNIPGTSEFTIPEVLVKKCCEKQCFRQLSFLDIQTIREQIQGLSETIQNKFIVKYLFEHSGAGFVSPVYNVSGKIVCEKCWRLSCGVRRKRFSRLKSEVSQGAVTIEHGRQGLLSPIESTMRVVSWMRSFFDKIGDKLPTKNSVHLPSCMTKADVYGLAYDDLTDGGLSCPSPSTFYRVWNKEFANVVIPKVQYI